ncbi:efflux RND transporter periplasmic adaptor subunit [Sphingomonas sp. So64.6b]|uniref:efflux RND transporter periplasmic adaptor subunit n=1 Tax=Sphingomonas sp. So64.6b TaxID=2997354 RepID=UPI0016046F07|nr:efflux RND transporter periplasmic adaptor subunit [Sphingomonas sp. So64.6b]QNA84807.1 efflux RND transporter periplasmic adaptor subunit [Sphingomonas sp. So64.6b]
MRWMVIGVAVVLGGCGSPKPVQETAHRTDVRIIQVGADNQPLSIAGVGTVALRREASLGFTSPGRIERIGVQEGDSVARGQVLAALDTTAVAAEVARIDAERIRAASEYRRSAVLLEKGWVTRPRVESAQAALQAANAQLSAARFQASAARIVAPGPGTVLARLVEPGQVITAGTPVLIVGDRSSGYVVRVPLADRDASRLSIGAPAQVTLGAFGDVPVTGQVIEIAGRADRATGTFMVEIGVPNDPRLRSGQIGKVAVTGGGGTGGRGTTGIRVPAGAVFAARAGAAFVYVVDRATGKLTLRRIAVGDTDDRGIQVTSGLGGGEWLAASRIDRLRDGMTVNPITGPTGAAK